MNTILNTVRTGIVIFFVGLSASLAQAQAEADLVLGEKLLTESNCAQCHIRRVGGDGSAIYNPQGRINSLSALNTMVQQCDTNLGLGFFPDEIEAIAAVLNRDYYHFK